MSLPKPAPVASPAPVVAPEPVIAPVLPPAPAHVEKPKSVEATEQAQQDGEEEEEIDENDPLWKATLKIAKGDRKEALKMLEDPDALMAFPEVAAALAEAEKDDAQDSSTIPESAAAKIGGGITSKTIVDDDVFADDADIELSTADSGGSPDAKSSSKAEAALEAFVDLGDVKELDSREHLNVVFIGHVDAGKSTLSGSILVLMGMVDQRTIEKYEREAKQRNRESWFLAFIMDTGEEERARGKTVEVGRAFFSTVKNRYTILDAPGHKNYVPNMIAGASQADVGVLVISARKGEFETGFEKAGQTREHAMLAKTLGIQYLIVVINKMDDPTVEWSKERYEECVSKLKPYLKGCGYVIKRDVKFIPISALSGDNVLKEVKSETCPWWNEYCATGQHNTTTSTLMETFDSLTILGRDPAKPLRIPVLDRYLERGCVVLGKVEAGTLTMGDELMICPTKKVVRADAIYVNEEKVRSIKPGENVLIKFNCNVEDFQKGYVLCHPSSVCPKPRQFSVQLFLVELLEHRPIFSSGYEAVLHIHTLEVEVQVIELICVIDGDKKMKRPFARTGQQCVAKLRVVSDLSTCIEKFEDFPGLGRVTLRDEGKTISIGKVVGITREGP